MVEWLSVPSWSKLAMAVAAVYGFFFLLGLGLASYASYMKCQKTDTSAQSKEAAIFSLYPTLTYIVVRALSKFRVHFESIYHLLDKSEYGLTRASWISVAYLMVIASLAGIMGLVDDSTRAACVPSGSEAAAFRQKLLEETAARSAKLDPPGTNQISSKN
jgi:hypothetical protein